MVFWVLVAAVLLTPLAIGSVVMMAWAMLACLVGVLLLVWCSCLFGGWDSASLRTRLSPWYVVPFVLICFWIGIQLWPTNLQSPTTEFWQGAFDALEMMPRPAPLSINPFETVSALVRLLTYAGIFWLAAQYCYSTRRAEQAFVSIAVTGLAYGLYGLVVQFGGFDKVLWLDKAAYANVVTSTFVNRNSYATFAGIGLICTIGVLVKRYVDSTDFDASLRRNVLNVIRLAMEENPVLVLAALVILTSLTLTASRAGILCTFVGLAAFFLTFRPAGAMTSRNLGKVAFVVALCIVGVATYNGAKVLDRMTTADADMDERLKIYQVTLEAIKTAPLTGFGFGTYADAIPRFRDERIDGPFDKAHSTYLEMAVEVGLPAAALILLALVGLIRQCASAIRTPNTASAYPAIGLGVTALVATHSLVDFSMQIPAVAALYAMVMGIAVGQSVRCRESVRDL